MSQETPWRADEAVTLVGRETTVFSPSAAPTMIRAYPEAGSITMEGLTQEEIPIAQESVHLHDYQAPVKGTKGGDFPVSLYLQPDAAAFNSAATPADTHLSSWLKAAFGGHGASAGSTVASSADDTHITVDAGHGSRFAIGAWALAPVSSQLLPVRVSAIATDALTLDFGMGTGLTADNAGDVINCRNFYFDPASTESLYVQHLEVGSASNEAYALKGCLVETLEFDMATIDKPIMAKLKLQVGDWEHPSDDVITTSVGTDPLGTPFVMDSGALFYLQATNVATRVSYPVLSANIKLTLGMAYAKATAGGTNGRKSVFREGQRLAVEMTVRTASYDITPTTTWWASRTELQGVLLVPQGSGLSRKWLIFDVPRCVLVGKPKPVKEGGMRTTEFVVNGAMRSRSGSTAQARSPFTLAYGG